MFLRRASTHECTYELLQTKKYASSLRVEVGELINNLTLKDVCTYAQIFVSKD
jgi:hypothetical protein